MSKIIKIHRERCSQLLEVDFRGSYHYCHKCGRLIHFSINYFHIIVFFLSLMMIFTIILSLTNIQSTETSSIIIIILSVSVIAGYILIPAIKSRLLESKYLDSIKIKDKTIKSTISASVDGYSAEIENAFGFTLGDEFDIKSSLLKASEIKKYNPGDIFATKKNGKKIGLLIQADKEFNVENREDIEIKTYFTKPFQFHNLVKPREKSPHFSQFYVSITPITNLIYEIFAYNYKQYDDYKLIYVLTKEDKDGYNESGECTIYEIDKSVLFAKYKEMEEMIGYLYGEYKSTKSDLKISSIWEQHSNQIELTYKPLIDEYLFILGHLLKITYTDLSTMTIFEREKKEIEEEIRLNKDKPKTDKLERLEKFDIKGL